MARVTVLSAGLWAACVAAPVTASAAPAYQVTQLGDLGLPDIGPRFGAALAISSTGMIAGYATNPDIFQSQVALRWPAGSTSAVPLDHLPIDSAISSAVGRAINDIGTVVGDSNYYADNQYQGTQPVRWNAGGTSVVRLGTLATVSGYGGANAINNAEEVYGYSGIYGVNDTRAVRWLPGQTTPIELPNLGTSASGQTLAQVKAVNNSGVLVGEASLYKNGFNYGRRPVRWDADGARIVELPNLGGADEPTDYVVGTAVAVNQSGVSVGMLYTNEAGELISQRAVRWSADGTQVTELQVPTRPEFDHSFATVFGIDSIGDILGSVYYKKDGSELPFIGGALLWPAGETTPISLDSLIDPASDWDVYGYSINDAGVIVGEGRHPSAGPNSDTYPIRLDPVPEPGATIAAIACAFGLLRRRRTAATRTGRE